MASKRFDWAFATRALSKIPRKIADRLVISGMILALILVILRHTVVTADAYVTFRVVDNFVHGYGLRWNTDERVEVYTHPLWMLLHIPFYALWENIFTITVALSVLCTAGAVAITIGTFRKPWLPTLALLVLPLIASLSFTRSSIMGLENPLAHLLFAAFGWALFKSGKRFWLWITLFCSLALVNRLDNIVLYVPPVLYLLATRRPLKIGQCLLGSLPIIGWEAFSLFYYGFPFPNTKYAKMESVTDMDTVIQGVHYLYNLLATDMAGAEFLFAAVILLPLYRFFAADGKQVLGPEMLSLILGILLYCLYVIDIGGTYLSGRFWSLPVFASVWVIYGVAGSYMPRRPCLLIAMLLVAFKLFFPTAPTMIGACPVCFTGGIWPKWYSITPQGYHIYDKPVPLPAVDRNIPADTYVTTGVGIFGYTEGPRVHMIDSYAVTDPLLARLPNTGIPMTESIQNHWLRDTPEGYLEAVKTGSLDQMDPALAEYYRRLRLVISGDLWDPARLKEIVRFNVGENQYLIEKYLRNRETAPDQPSDE